MNQKANNRFSRFFVYLINKLWLSIAAIVILTAVSFTLFRFILPQINYFKSDIESWLENKYQLEVEFERIDAEWGTHGPIIAARNFSIKSNYGKQNLLSVDSFSIHIDGLKSVLSKTLITEQVDINGAVLNFILNRKLTVSLDSIDKTKLENNSVDIESTSSLLLSTLFAQKNLTLENSKISLLTLSGKQFKYHLDKLSVQNFSEVHQLSGVLIDEFQGEINLVAEIHGDPSLKESTTQLYLEGKQILISNLPLFDNLKHLKPNHGDLNWRLWADWNNGHWDSAIGDVDINQVVWPKVSINKSNQNTQAKKMLEPISFEKFSGRFSWIFEDESSGVLALNDINLIKGKSEIVNLPELFFLFKQDDSFDLSWDLITHDFQINPFVEYLDILFDQEITQNAFKKSGLNVNLDTLGVRLTKKQGVWYLPKIYTLFSEIKYNDLFGMPNANGLSGELSYANNQGFSVLKGRDIQLDFAGFFRDEIDLSELDVSLSWTGSTRKSFDLMVHSARFSNKDLTLDATSRYFYQDDEPVLSLYTELSDVDLTNKSQYLPVAVMNQSLIDYLDTSIYSGTFSTVKSVIHGPIKSFPFDDEEGLFAALAELKGAKYQFLPDWPLVETIDAELLFEANGMDIKLSNASSINNQLKSARALVKDFSQENSILELDLKVSSKNNNGKNYLLNSPLNSIGESVAILDYSGALQTDLSFNIGLGDSSSFSLKGSVLPDINQSQVVVAGMTFTNLDGRLYFDESGIKKSTLSAKYYDAPLTAVLIGAETNSQPELKIDVKGVLTSDALKDFVGDSWAQFAIGQTKFNSVIEIGVAKERSKSTVKFLTDLKGIEINLPDQFFKTKDKITPLQLDIELDEISQANILWQGLDGKWQWKNTNNSTQTTGGIFNYNFEHKSDAMIDDNFVVNAKLKNFNLAKWNKIFESTKAQYANSPQSLFETKFNIEVENIENTAVELFNVQLAATKYIDGGWNILFHSPLTDGKLKVLTDAPWQLDIQRLTFDLKPDFIELEPIDKENIQTRNILDNPYLWPEVDIKCDDCKLFSRYLGQIKAKLRNNLHGLNLNGLISNKKNHQLSFNLDWLQKVKKQNNDELNNNSVIDLENITLLEFDLKTSDLGKLMNRWDYPISVEESDARVVGKLNWSQKPWQFEPLEINGDAHFELGEGYLSEVDNVKARFLSLFNLQTLVRRLQLDFKEIYKKGFYYGKLSGDVALRDGLVQTDNVYIDGNAAEIKLAGNVDLKNKTIEQWALTTPKLSASLPVLVGWAAADPATGLLFYLFNKIMEPAIDVVTQVEYRIYGDLDDIQVEEISKSKSTMKVKREEKQDKQEESLEVKDRAEQQDSSKQEGL